MLYFSNQKPRFFRRGFLTTIIYLLSVSCTAEASVAVSQEVEQVLDFRGGGEFLFHFFYGFVEFQARAEEEAVGFLEGALDVGRDVVSCDAYGADLLIQTNKYHKKSNRTLILIMQPLELR